MGPEYDEAYEAYRNAGDGTQPEAGIILSIARTMLKNVSDYDKCWSSKHINAVKDPDATNSLTSRIDQLKFATYNGNVDLSITDELYPRFSKRLRSIIKFKTVDAVNDLAVRDYELVGTIARSAPSATLPDGRYIYAVGQPIDISRHDLHTCPICGSIVSAIATTEYGREWTTFRCGMAMSVMLAGGMNILVGASPPTACSLYSTGTVLPEKD